MKYITNIINLYKATEDITEHTLRTPIENFLNYFIRNHSQRNLVIVHEPKKEISSSGKTRGRPDFKVLTQEKVIVGYIETKKLEENLERILDTEQITRYKTLSENIILTNYLRFMLLRQGEVIFDVSISDIKKIKKSRKEVTQISQCTELFNEFFSYTYTSIINSRDLSVKLAERAIFLRNFCYRETDQNKDPVICGLFQVFRNTLLPKLTSEHFADIYAQTITYSLFLAFLNLEKGKLDKEDIYKNLPKSFSLIQEVFKQLLDYPESIVWVIDGIVSILNSTDKLALLKELSYKNRKKGSDDPYIYFYEEFLKQYDPEQKERRGVYYTPIPVVSFIVDSIEILLKQTFHLKDGFIDSRVTLLDFAAGTGTFLLEAFKRAIQETRRIGNREIIKKEISEHLIKNFYGFELLLAPYVVAHLKISEYLKDSGYELHDYERLNIFLTNTLVHEELKEFPGFHELAKEGRTANKIKHQPILVILGNPPYSGNSANKKTFLDEELKKNYYYVNGKSLTQEVGERNPKWLQDDYVKFIHFAQWKMNQVERGVTGIITNHGYLDNPTFVGMRQSLMKTFNEIYILDLHGNINKKEKSPDGSEDENVFDIRQGVSIALFVKDSNMKNCKVYHKDLYGLRKLKYDSLLASDIKKIKWERLKPTPSFYSLFTPVDLSSLKHYKKFIGLKEMFNLNSVAIVTAKDDILIHSSKDFLLKNVGSYYKIKLNTDYIQDILYRPFDLRKIYYDAELLERPRTEVMQHMLEENIGLITRRQQLPNHECNYYFITDVLLSDGCIRSDNKGVESIFLLYRYNNNHDQQNDFLFDEEEKRDNFTIFFRKFIQNKYINKKISPEIILGYIYAILYSPAYRNKYQNFLRTDFPRIPFIADYQLFYKLYKIGWNLIQHHLMKESYVKNIYKMEGKGRDMKVKEVTYKNQKIYFNKDRYFAPIPKNIWDFHVGGYQVLNKWLKERKKSEIELSIDDIKHFIKIGNILDYTLKTVKIIDRLTKGWI